MRDEVGMRKKIHVGGTKGIIGIVLGLGLQFHRIGSRAGDGGMIPVMIGIGERIGIIADTGMIGIGGTTGIDATETEVRGITEMIEIIITLASIATVMCETAPALDVAIHITDGLHQHLRPPHMKEFAHPVGARAAKTPFLNYLAIRRIIPTENKTTLEKIPDPVTETTNDNRSIETLTAATTRPRKPS